MVQIINTGKWSTGELDRLLHSANRIKEPGKKIEVISALFLDVGYARSTLIGDTATPEAFVVNLERVDCFTFLDYVEAMRHSDSFDAFVENLKRVRYHAEGSSAGSTPPCPPLEKGGDIGIPPLKKGDKGGVSFENRNHFFTDWIEYNSGFVKDVTDSAGGQKAIQVMKRLNLRKDGSCFIEGIKYVERMIKYIPAGAIDNAVIDRLKTGDYAGIYSDEEGLDVSHVGIIIRSGDKISFRHASSRASIQKVIDEDFINYMADKPGLPGLIILRPK